jgi:hypothetical protein
MIEKHYATAIVRLREGRHEDAVPAADAVVDMVTAQNPTGFHWAYFCAGAAEVYFEVLDDGGPYAAAHRAAIEQRAGRACKALRRVSRTFGTVRPQRWLVQGLLDWQLGRHSQAHAAWERADETAARMDMPFERARARFELARHGGDHAAELLRESAATFERLGARYMLRRVREEQGAER